MPASRAGAQAPAAAPFMVHQLKPNVYWVEGGGGNSTVIVGTNGVIVVDAKTTKAGGQQLLGHGEIALRSSEVLVPQVGGELGQQIVHVCT